MCHQKKHSHSVTTQSNSTGIMIDVLTRVNAVELGVPVRAPCGYRVLGTKTGECRDNAETL